MAEHKRTPHSISSQAGVGTGPYLARIVNHLDPTFMGSLEVTLLRDQGNVVGEDNQTYVVRCASPFFGYTGFEFMGSNDGSKNTLDGYNDTQKSYGMWMVPPDVGVNVIVTFIDGDPAQGYWIGCVPARFANHMVPAIAASKQVSLDPSDTKKYNTNQPLPVAEVNRRAGTQNSPTIDPEKIKKPLHPIAEHFLRQGLLDDDIRGSTTSSARREAPSMVFGISSPGPLDKRPGAKKGRLGTIKNPTTTDVPVSRLGGTQFVMDDGDARYQRKTPASTGPVDYADILAGEKGEPTIPYNEYFRVRTRTGHQLLMHNSEDLIYIGNSRGTTWIELTSDGKIDIYAEDSISIHTKNDLNIRADRDINLEAGRNINMRAIDGRLQMDIATNWNVVVGENGKVSVGSNFDLNTGLANKFTAGTTTDILSGGQHTETASIIHMNGPKAAVAEKATPLSLHINPSTESSASWADTRYQSGVVSSIMKRIPMHEPWLLHENQAPQILKPKNTDRES